MESVLTADYSSHCAMCTIMEFFFSLSSFIAACTALHRTKSIRRRKPSAEETLRWTSTYWMSIDRLPYRLLLSVHEWNKYRRAMDKSAAKKLKMEWIMDGTAKKNGWRTFAASLVECVFLKSFIINSSLLCKYLFASISSVVCICTNSSGNLSQFVVLLLRRSADCCARYRYWIASLIIRKCDWMSTSFTAQLRLNTGNLLGARSVPRFATGEYSTHRCIDDSLVSHSFEHKLRYNCIWRMLLFPWIWMDSELARLFGNPIFNFHFLNDE